MNMSSEVTKVMHASLLGIGLFLIPALLLLPADWIYDRLAIRSAFNQDGVPSPSVSVTSIKKPSTVTFSNGAVVDVGYWPATISSAFWVMTTIAGAAFYIFILRRQIHNLVGSVRSGSG
jgi:hypothetical protein